MVTSTVRLDSSLADVHMDILGADSFSHYNLLVDLRGHQLINASTGLTSNGYIALTPVYISFGANHANWLMEI